MNIIINFIKKYQILTLIVAAFIFSVVIHLMWQFVFGDNPLYYWNGTLMINTNDGYYFASGVQKELYGMHQENPLVPSIYDRGLVFVTYLLAKILPFSLDSIIFYMPAIVSSFVVIPIILIASLYKNPLWGFFSALLASIAWSYYNRTLVGYYDTDMFALTIPVFILYFLIKSVRNFELRDIFLASLIISMYEFLYLPGKTVAYALGFVYLFYLLYLYIVEKKSLDLLLKFSIFIFIALSKFYMPVFNETILKIVLITFVYFVLKNKEFSIKILLIINLLFFGYFLLSTNALGVILGRIIRYTQTGTEQEGFHFFGVFQTVSEASGIPMFPDGTGRNNVAYRVIGSTVGFLIFIIGYILLVIRKKEFILALPLVGIGIFAHWGGLRFTVYAVPIAALSAIYLLFELSSYIFKNEKKYQYIFVIVATIALLYPNIKHTLKYNPGTVFNKYEVNDLVKLGKISNPKDYTLTWWDYGYPIWYYSNTNTLIDGGKHNADNFIASTLFLSSSATLMKNLSILAVENFVKQVSELKKYNNNEDLNTIEPLFKMKNSNNEIYVPNIYSGIIRILLREKQSDQKEPNEFLTSLENSNINLPKKTRDIFIYAPLKMYLIFLTVSQFGNVDLKNGKKLRDIWFYPTYAISTNKSLVKFRNGIKFNYKNGYLIVNNKKIGVKYFITTIIKNDGSIEVLPTNYKKGDMVVLFIENFKKFILMDSQTFKSNYVQMFLLGNYDKDIFDLVIKSPYSRVYQIK